MHIFMEREVDNLQEICELDANVTSFLVDALNAIFVISENVQLVRTYFW